MPRKSKPKPEKRVPLPRHPDRFSRLQNRNVMLGNRRTSMRLEPELWAALMSIAAAKNSTLNDIVTALSIEKPNECLTSAVRVFIVQTLLAERTQ